MGVKKVKTGWQADVQPEGRGGKRVRKTFRTKREAENYETEQKALANKGEWVPPSKDKRRLSDLIKEWYDLHGHTLKDEKKRLGKLNGICQRLGDPIAKNFTGEDWLRHRKERLQQKDPKTDKFINPNTVNHEHAYLSAVFGTLIKLKNWNLENPMQGIPKIKLDEPDLIYLELDQVEALLEELQQSKNPDVILVAKICLATGARWGEAETLKAEQVRQGKVHFTKTKNSKARAIPVDEELEKDIKKGRPRFGRLFPGTCHQAFARAVERAGINLPDGQMTHVLRHTFASQFMIEDGNILKLKDILGHKTLTMTMRYAKLAPKHLIDAVHKNPLAALKRQQSVNQNVQKPA